MQQPPPDHQSYFDRFVESMNEVVASLKFRDDALITTVEIARATPQTPESAAAKE